MQKASILFGHCKVEAARLKWKEPEIKAALIIKVVMSKILIFVSKQQDYHDRSGPIMILLLADKSLIIGPGATPEMYLVKPTMFH